MGVPKWLRKIPHLHYGKYGGAYLDATQVDPLDELFRQHDIACNEAGQIKDKAEQKTAYKEADKALFQGLKKLGKSDFKKIPLANFHFPFFHRGYAHIYRLGAMAVFGRK